MTVAEQLSALSAILAQRRIHSLFQPIMCLSEHRVFGHEALSRGPSNSPLHAPLNLFTIARQAGRLTELEAACRESACRRFSEQQLQGKLFLNISPESLLEPHYPSGLTLKLLEQVGLPPNRVVIELTEHTPTDDFQLLSNALHHYRDMGFSIALDDLGAGYSSLRLWSELRPEYVKIDRHFIDGIHRDPLKREFVGSILQIARASKAQVIAEGIELAEELAVLVEMGVDLVQGYLLGRPQEMGVRDSGLLPALTQVPLAEQPTVHLNATIGQLLELFGRYQHLEALEVVDADGRGCGLIHRDALPVPASSRVNPLLQQPDSNPRCVATTVVGAGLPANTVAAATENDGWRLASRPGPFAGEPAPTTA
ncbi:EAL domain-containing protein [Pseudomonas putida]|uniref:EAL domain-containing protein n=1 Tax=Pseudomonas putida group TaxID=136845 RepID=UPI001BB0C398|nr:MULTISPECIES: EAL domain-containing protein [Pseudomonas putida group]EKT4565424.1 EAL domain-containing protein [Pseudomonas putida]MCE1052882.1 EAL domain-containing protein [Pseudomonas alloputida]MCE1061522.1 EAL domain-containing protein [Pseudomonas alloputida]QUG91134.1 EAL domain-containing protein [Pseudomonas putida]